jgi:hypothetical protein
MSGPSKRHIPCLVPALSLFLIAAAPAEKGSKTMKTISVEQLGDVAPRHSVGSWRQSEAIEPMPIVQWRSGEVGLAFYYEWSVNGLLGRYKQKIAPLKTGLTDSLKSLGSDYPIRFSAHVDREHGERGLAAYDVDHHVAADLTGDGVDELILPRHQGTMEVYGSQGKIASWTAPNRAEKYYAHDAVLVHKARQGSRELVYYVYRREPYKGGEADIPAALAEAHAATPADTILEVSLTGIHAVPLLGLPGKLAKILGLAYWSPPGKEPELVVCSLLNVAGQQAAYLSRHRHDGTPVGDARPIYAELGFESRLEFVTFEPGDASLVAVGADSNLVAYVWPDKEVNWFKTVTFGGAWRGDDPLLFRGLVDRGSQHAKVLFQQGRTLYVRDEDGICYRMDGRKDTAMSTGKPVPWQEIPPASPYHRLAQIRLLEGP